VVIESEGQRAVITGDINHHPCQLVHPAWATNLDSDIPAATATRRERLFAQWAGQPILVIGTHYAAPMAYISGKAPLRVPAPRAAGVVLHGGLILTVF
jgi:hypothetical protein